MTEIVVNSPDGLILKFALREQEILIAGAPVKMRELDTQLSFSRKPVSLADMGGGSPERVFIFDHVELDAMGFDCFARNLGRDHAWLEGRYTLMPIAHARACVMVTSPNRPVLFVDTQGNNYARYAARLG